MRNKKMPVSGLMLKAKALEIHGKIKESNCTFNASDGWLQNFKKRYGVRLLKISGEKLSAQPQLVDPFKQRLKTKIDELGLCTDQLYNADESGLYWKQLPEKTYVSSLEKSAPGAKMEKQRLTFMCCSNASGSHKLKLLAIGKARNPRCFKQFACPVNYKSSKSAWMTSSIFYDWFHHFFVPEVTDFLKLKGLPVKALLLLDNAPSHPSERELTSQDGSICAMFLPPNVTSLIQPMDQNIFKIIKLHYRSSLLALIANKDTCILESIKTTTLKDAITILDISWGRIANDTLAKSWKNILSLVFDQDDPEDNIPLSMLRESWQAEVRELEERIVDLLQALNPQVEISASLVQDWNNNANEYTITECDAFEIEDGINDSNDDEEHDSVSDQQEVNINSKEVVKAFDNVIKWAEKEMVEQKDFEVLIKLKEKAISNMVKQKTRQQMITEFFS